MSARYRIHALRQAHYTHVSVLFGSLTALSALAVLWLSHGAGAGNSHGAVFGPAVSPILYVVFVGPFALLFVVFLLRGMRRRDVADVEAMILGTKPVA
jgi:hypothetical protein